MDVGQHLPRVSLVVDGVERGDDVEGVGRVVAGDVDRFEGRVGQPEPAGLGGAGRQPFRREIDPDEPAGRERARHDIDGVPTAATEVGHIDTGPQACRQPVDHRQDHVDQGSVEHFAALFGHQRVKARILAVGQPAAVVEAADHLLLHLAQQRDELRDPREIVRTGGPGQHGGAVLGKRIRLCRRVVVDDPPATTPPSHSRT